LLLLNLPNNLEPAASKKTRRRRAEIDKQRRDDDRGSREVGCGVGSRLGAGGLACNAAAGPGTLPLLFLPITYIYR